METAQNPPATAKIYRPNMDGLRFIMCLGVALLHFGLYFFTHKPDFIQKCDYFVDVFFVLSAYLLMRSNFVTQWDWKNYTTFLKKRLVRLYPLYFAALSFFILIAVVAALGIIKPENAERYDLTLLPYHILLIQSWGFVDSLTFNYVAWAISALWLMYIAFPLFAIPARKHPGAFIVATAVIAVALDILCRKFTGEPIAEIQQHNFGFVRAIPSFMFGIWLASTDEIKIKPILAVALFWIISIITFVWPGILEGIARFGFLYPALFFFVLADNQGAKTVFALPVFKKLAPYAYGIFLLHPIIATVLLAFLMPKFIDTATVFAGPYGTVWSYVGLVVCLVLSVIAGMIGYYLIEKPAEKFLKRYI